MHDILVNTFNAERDSTKTSRKDETDMMQDTCRLHIVENLCP